MTGAEPDGLERRVVAQQVVHQWVEALQCFRRFEFGFLDRSGRVLTLAWMNRAARHTPKGPWARIGRLGGYYNLKYYRGCDHLVANTRDIVDHIRRQGWPADRVHYLPNFADVTAAPPVSRESLQTPADVPVALALGRFHANKAFDVLLEAVAATPGLYLWLGGDGELRGEIEAQVARLGLGSRVRLLGWRGDVPALFAACDIAVCPSRHEPLGNVILEAWAHRRPVVAAASAGPAELIRHEQTGLLVPVDDAASLAAALQRLAGDRPLREHLSQSGRAAYDAGFTEGAVVRQMEQLAQAPVHRPLVFGLGLAMDTPALAPDSTASVKSIRSRWFQYAA